MAKGFQQPNAEELQVQAAIKRLRPSVQREDRHALDSQIQMLLQRYSSKVVATAMTKLVKESSWMTKQAMGMVPKSMQPHLYAMAFDVIADKLEEFGMQPGKHLRVSDEGFVLTKQAIAAFKAGGYPGWRDFGDGVNSMDGIGLPRKPFVHPLTEAGKPDDNVPVDWVNLWGCASMIISAAQGWIESDDNGKIARENIDELVALVAPTVSTDVLLKRAQYDDRELLRLCSLLHKALDIKATQAFEK